ETARPCLALRARSAHHFDAVAHNSYISLRNALSSLGTRTHMSKYVYFFGAGKADGRTDMKPLLGGKGANLAEMTNIGLPVPAGFTITTEVCNYYYQNSRKYPPELRDQVTEALQGIEKIMGAKFGDTTNPL